MFKCIKKWFNLGLIYENGKPILHRTLLKITLNPILRKFGYVIASEVSDEGKFIKYVFKDKSIFNQKQ